MYLSYVFILFLLSFHRTIRIWDYTQDSCVNILVGHAAPVRGLLWNPEIPYILISGSWDYTIRVWDTRYVEIRECRYWF